MPSPKDEARSVMGEYEETIYGCIFFGWDEVKRNLPPHWLLDMTPTMRANVVRDLTVGEARRRFEDISTVHIHEHRKLVLFIFDNKYALRFKKFNEDKRSSNNETQQSLAFLHQYEIPGIPRLRYIQAGYQLDDLQTAITGMFITSPLGSRNEWSYELMPPATPDVLSHPAKEQKDGIVLPFKFKESEVAQKKKTETDGA